MALRMKNFNILGVHWKIRFLGGEGFTKIGGGDCLKRGAWTVCRFKVGVWQERGKGECWYPNAHYGIKFQICARLLIPRWHVRYLNCIYLESVFLSILRHTSVKHVTINCSITTQFGKTLLVLLPSESAISKIYGKSPLFTS